MANPYCTVQQFLAFYDRRAMLQLSGDDNLQDGQPSTIQFLLDVQASELESGLGAYTLPITISPVPLILTKWVAATTAPRLFARRTDAPKQVEADLEWAKNWMDALQKFAVNIPGLARGVQPKLQDSNFVDGRSAFDYALGGLPSPTGPSKGR